MSKRKELVKNTIILMIGKICTQFISFLLLPLYTAVLSAEQYGIVDLVVTYVGLLAPIITLQLEMAVFRFLIDARDNREEEKRIFSNVFVVSFLILFFASILIGLVCNLLNFKFTVYFIVLLFITSLTSITLQAVRGLGDNVGYSLGSIIAGGLNVLLNVFFLIILNFHIEGMFLSQIVANLVCFIFLSFRIKLHKYICVSLVTKKYIGQLLKYSLPLIPNGIVWWIINASDRTIISVFLGATANGIYAISNKFSNVFISIYNIYNMSWTESVSLHLNDDTDNFINTMLNTSLKFFATICICLISIMPIIFGIMIDKAYNDSYYYIPILLCSTFFNIFSSMLGAIYVAIKHTTQISVTSFMAGLINIIINILFIKSLGIYAAAISTLISFIVMSLYRYYDIKKHVQITIDYRIIILISFSFALVSLCYYIGNLFTFVVAIVYSFLLFILLNKEILLSLIDKNCLKKVKSWKRKKYSV